MEFLETWRKFDFGEGYHELVTKLKDNKVLFKRYLNLVNKNQHVIDKRCFCVADSNMARVRNLENAKNHNSFRESNLVSNSKLLSRRHLLARLKHQSIQEQKIEKIASSNSRWVKFRDLIDKYHLTLCNLEKQKWLFKQWIYIVKSRPVILKLIENFNANKKLHSKRKLESMVSRRL